jgi:hypothetical protein
MSATDGGYRVSGHYDRHEASEEESPEGERASFRLPRMPWQRGPEPVPADEDEDEAEESVGLFRNTASADSADSQDFDMSLVELLYSTSSFYAIVVPGKICLFCCLSR